MRTIDGDSLMELARNHKDGKVDCNDIARFPTIDAVPVVRCKDCKYCDPENLHCDNPMGTILPISRKADDFCSYGERRCEDETD